MDAREPFLAVAVALLLSTSASAFNITRLLGQFPEFGAFNDLLTQTQLYAQINSRQTITVLAVANDSIGALSSKPLEVQKRILSNHVILDYYDTFKLQRLKQSSLLTTLYQSTGLAQRRQGFLNVSVTSDGIVFGSAVQGSPLNAKLLAGVASRPYNISVLQVSSPIIAPGMDPSEPLPPLPSPEKKSPPPPAAETPEAAPSPQEDDMIPSPAETPTESPADSPAPAAPKKKHHPADEEEPADSSSASRLVSAGLVAVLVSCLVA